MRRLHLLFAVVLQLARSASAMPSYADTIELKAAVADVVVIGRIGSVELSAPPEIERPQCVWRRITVAVTESLRGTPAPQVVFYICQSSGDPPPAWLSDQRDALFFLRQGKRYG